MFASMVHLCPAQRHGHNLCTALFESCQHSFCQGLVSEPRIRCNHFHFGTLLLRTSVTHQREFFQPAYWLPVRYPSHLIGTRYDDSRGKGASTCHFTKFVHLGTSAGRPRRHQARRSEREDKANDFDRGYGQRTILVEPHVQQRYRRLLRLDTRRVCTDRCANICLQKSSRSSACQRSRARGVAL